MEELNDADLRILIEAVGDWEHAQNRANTMTMMLGSIFAGSKEKAEEFQAVHERQVEKQKASAELRSEQAILLKAKLIHLRQKMAAEKLGGGNDRWLKLHNSRSHLESNEGLTRPDKGLKMPTAGSLRPKAKPTGISTWQFYAPGHRQ